MIITLNATEFCKVPEKQEEYFRKVTFDYLKDGLEVKRYKGHPRRLFDSLSDILFQKGLACPRDEFGKPAPDPEADLYAHMMITIDWPRKDFINVSKYFIRMQHRLVDDGFGKYQDSEFFTEDPAALYRNISHLLAVIDCNIRGKERLYNFYC